MAVKQNITKLEKVAVNPSLLLGAGLPLAAAAGALLSKPEIRRGIAASATKKNIQSQDLEASIPQSALDTAASIQQQLESHGLDPKTIRMAIDAPPGSGKTTLSKALVQQAGMKHYGLDWVPNKGIKTLMGGGALEHIPHAPRAGEIVEHHLLLRSHDPELFDAIVHIKKTPEEIKQHLMRRGRGAAMSTMFNYPKSLDAAALAFDTLSGDQIDLGNGVYMKLRPQEGWNQQALDEALQANKINPEGLSRHEKILSALEGKKQTGAGWVPYAKSPFSPLQMAGILASIPAGILAGKAIKKFASIKLAKLNYEYINSYEQPLDRIQNYPNPLISTFNRYALPKEMLPRISVN